MKIIKNTTLMIVMAGLIMLGACGGEENVNPDNGGFDTTVVLADVEQGAGKATVFGDTSMVLTGMATWDDEGGTLFMNGNEYLEYTITIQGESEDQLVEIDLLERESSSTVPGPDAGTYEIGAGTGQNSITIENGDDRYISQLSSTGSITVSREAGSMIMEIQFDIRGLSGDGKRVNISAAAKVLPIDGLATVTINGSSDKLWLPFARLDEGDIAGEGVLNLTAFVPGDEDDSDVSIRLGSYSSPSYTFTTGTWQLSDDMLSNMEYDDGSFVYRASTGEITITEVDTEAKRISGNYTMEITSGDGFDISGEFINVLYR